MNCVTTTKQNAHTHTQRSKISKKVPRPCQTTKTNTHTQTSLYIPIEWPKSIFIFHKERIEQVKKIDFSIKSYNQAIALIDEKTKTTHIRCNTCTRCSVCSYKRPVYRIEALTTSKKNNNNNNNCSIAATKRKKKNEKKEQQMR